MHVVSENPAGFVSVLSCACSLVSRKDETPARAHTQGMLGEGSKARLGERKSSHPARAAETKQRLLL